jgi:integral membrane protein (TIGR01906 family)
MKAIRYALGILCSLSLLTAILISSIELAVYGDMGYFEKEYTRYQVTEDVRMELDDLMDVTREMMAYLRGDREDLHIMTTIGGEAREFFNAREIAHMEDVRNLFLGGLAIRRACLILCVLCLIALLLLKADLKKTLPACIQWGTGLFLAILAVLAGLIASDFNKYFVLFHKIFFTNDLWLLDPATDLLINIVPEPFFMDMAARIGLIFAGFILLLLAVSTGLRIYFKKKEMLSHA